MCPLPCNPVTQTCRAGAKCSFDATERFVCAEDGDDGLRSPCVGPAGASDSCTAGALCVEWDLDGVNTCHEMCATDSDCADMNTICNLTLNGADDRELVDLCAYHPTCDPLRQNCAADERCDSHRDTRSATTMFRCFDNGSIPSGGACGGPGSEPCTRGTACVGSEGGGYFCEPFCRTSAPSCPGGEVCASVTGWPSGTGVCIRP